MKIVAMSDLHGFMPEIPECDLLLIAGDVCPDFSRGARIGENVDVDKRSERQWNWFKQVFIPYLERYKFDKCLMTWGNHDWIGEELGVEGQGVYGVGDKKDIDVVVDELVEYQGLKIWMTPWSNQFMEWAFMKPHAELAEKYVAIPEDVDIVVSHQPPYGCGDWYLNPNEGMPVVWEFQHIGSSELRYKIEELKPKMVVCGHLHGGFGRYEIDDTVVWNVSVLDENYRLVNRPTVIELEEEDGQVVEGPFDYSPSRGWKWPVRNSSNN